MFVYFQIQDHMYIVISKNNTNVTENFKLASAELELYNLSYHLAKKSLWEKEKKTELRKHS